MLQLIWWRKREWKQKVLLPILFVWFSSLSSLDTNFLQKEEEEGIFLLCLGSGLQYPVLGLEYRLLLLKRRICLWSRVASKNTVFNLVFQMPAVCTMVLFFFSLLVVVAPHSRWRHDFRSCIVIYSVQVFIPVVDSDWSSLDGQWLVHIFGAKLYW